jgi:hypothetical protein
MEFPFTPKIPESEWETIKNYGVYQRSILYHLNYGLPPLGYRATSQTAPSISRKRSYPGKVEPMDYPHLADLSFIKNLPPPLLFRGSRVQPQQTWGSEDEIKRLVENVIFDCLVLMEKDTELNLRSEITIDGIRPDILVIKLNGQGNERQIGFIEVKTPSNRDIHQSGRMHRQIADYAQMLCSTNGAPWSIGILATYDTWQIYKFTPGPYTGPEENDENDEDEKPDDPSFLASKLECSPVVKLDGSKQEVHALLIWALGQMLEMPSDAQRRLYPYLTKNSRTWQQLDGLGPVSVKLDQRIKRFYLVNELGRGSEGRVWQVAGGKSRKQCALKLYCKHDEEKARRESKLWKLFWDVDSYTPEFIDKIGVIMPICSRIEDLSGNREGILESIETIAKRGYVHLDLVDRHVARLEAKIVFLDLSSCQPIESGTTETDAIDQMRRQLFG